MSIQTYCLYKRKAANPLVLARGHLLILTPLETSDSFLKSLQQEVPRLKISKPNVKYTMRKAYYEGKEPEFPKEGKQLMATSAQVKATWAFDVSLANQIPLFIKPY
jgi:hypothetical protein